MGVLGLSADLRALLKRAIESTGGVQLATQRAYHKVSSLRAAAE